MMKMIIGAVMLLSVTTRATRGTNRRRLPCQEMTDTYWNKKYLNKTRHQQEATSKDTVNSYTCWCEQKPADPRKCTLCPPSPILGDLVKINVNRNIEIKRNGTMHETNLKNKQARISKIILHPLERTNHTFVLAIDNDRSVCPTSHFQKVKYEQDRTFRQGELLFVGRYASAKTTSSGHKPKKKSYFNKGDKVLVALPVTMTYSRRTGYETFSSMFTVNNHPDGKSYKVCGVVIDYKDTRNACRVRITDDRFPDGLVAHSSNKYVERDPHA